MTGLTKIQIIKTLLKDYGYNQVTDGENKCIDAVVDIWNLLRSQDINARIVVGNLANPDCGWTEIDHAWIIAEVEDSKWLAIETTNGTIVWEEGDMNYYKGYYFDNPERFKSFIKLREEYGEEYKRLEEGLNKIKKIVNQFKKL